MDDDVGSFFGHYLIERFHQRFGAKADARIQDWHADDPERGRLATGGSGLNALIEFKPDEATWAAEFAKLPRQHWCQRLSDVPSMERLADTCHFVGWDAGGLTRVGALLAFYSEACTPGAMLHSREARANSRHHAIFVDSVLDRRLGASDAGLREYLKFLAPLISHEERESLGSQQRILWLHLWDGSLRGYWLADFGQLCGLGQWLAGNPHQNVGPGQ